MISFIKDKLTCSRFTLIPLVCFFTILTYGETLPESIRDYLVYVLWAIIIIECAITCRLRFSKQAVSFIEIGLLFYMLVLILTLFGSGKTYFSSSICLTVGISIMIFICGAALGNKLNENDVEVILRWFVLGTLVMGSVYFFQNLSTGFNLTSRIYNNVSFNKNSAAQLISSAIYILILGVNKNKAKKNTILRIALIVYLTVILLLMRSRSCILCFAFAIIVMLLSKYTNRKVKKWICVVLGVAAIVLIFNSGLRKTLVEQILFANRDATNLDNLTSGRIAIYSSFWDIVKGNELVGSGALYYECFYLSAIVQFGFPVGLYLWGIVIHALRSVKKIYADFTYGWLMMILALSYSLNGVFEGLPPFGPGTKNFLLWLLFGLACSQMLYLDKDENRTTYPNYIE